jgi:hypothetical protein
VEGMEWVRNEIETKNGEISRSGEKDGPDGWLFGLVIVQHFFSYLISLSLLSFYPAHGWRYFFSSMGSGAVGDLIGMGGLIAFVLCWLMFLHFFISFHLLSLDG